MAAMIQKEFKLQLDNLWQMSILTFGMFAVGGVISLVMNAVLLKDGAEVVSIGWLFGLMGCLFWFFMVGMQTKAGMENAILMSRTRKSYLAAHYVVNLVYSAVMVAFAWVLGLAEKGFCALVWPGVSLQVSMTSWFTLPVALMIVIVGVILASFVGALISRFGRRAFWVLWTLWMFGFLVVPRMMGTENKNTLLGMIGQEAFRWINMLPLTAWKTLGAAGLLLCLVLTPVLLRRQAVTN